MADFTGSVLLRHGFNVVAVHDGVEAMNTGGPIKPDLVLLEINLAGGSGFEVCEDIAASRAPRDYRHHPWRRR